MCYGLMWQGNECEAVIKSLYYPVRKEKARVLLVETEKEFGEAWRSLLLRWTVFRLWLNALTANDCLFFDYSIDRAIWLVQ